MTTAYDTVNTLPEISFIGGTEKLFTFTAYDNNGVDLLNITSGTIAWLLCPYGQFSTPVLQKAGTITDANHFTISLSAADTLSLSGKYIQQVRVTDNTSSTFRPGQGTILIMPAIPEA